MKHPDQWRETVDPFSLPYRNFSLTQVIGYPHAGNDVFQARGEYQGRTVDVFIKAARQTGADIENEIRTISALELDLAPQIIDHDEKKQLFSVSLAKPGERLSTILAQNKDEYSLDYMYEYGQTLARLHSTQGDFPPVKDRRFFHVPDKAFFQEADLTYVYDYLLTHQPVPGVPCFCHGDFHYANILWENRHISAILDFELSGMGCREFDIAWALILRPGQQFLTTTQELERFLEGYGSLAAFRRSAVEYYMVQIYSHFYRFTGDEPAYQDHLRKFFEKVCR